MGEFEPHQRFQLFPTARNFTPIAQCWLVPGMDLSVIYTSRITCFRRLQE